MTLHIILRLLHIVSAVVWVGFGLFMVTMMDPVWNRMGAEARGYIAAFYRFSQIKIAFPVAALLTTLTGVLMYLIWFIDNGNVAMPWLAQAGNTVLLIGAVFGLLAFGHGIGLGRVTGRLIAATEQTTDQQIEGELAQQIDRLAARVSRSSRVSLALSGIALVLMSSARYLA